MGVSRPSAAMSEDRRSYSSRCHAGNSDGSFAALSGSGAGPHREDCPEVGVPCRAHHVLLAALNRARKKLMAANFVRCPRDRGESVNGGLPPPVHKKVTTNRNSPQCCACGAQGSFDSRARSGLGGRVPDPNHSRSLRASRRTSEARYGRRGVGSPDPNHSRSGVSVRLSPHFGSPSYAEGSRVSRPQPLPLRGLRAALAALRKPELRTEGSRVPRPQPLPLRGLRAALAALRKAGAKLRGRGLTRQRTPSGLVRCPRFRGRAKTDV